jgi:DNA-binding NtrC family response regulator
MNTGAAAMEHVDHILIVDDDREIRELVGNYLKKKRPAHHGGGGWQADAFVSGIDTR